MRKSVASTVALLIAFGFAPGASEAAQDGPVGPRLTLEAIMADPDWIGPPIQAPYWSSDGLSVYYSIKRSGTPIVDLHRIALDTGTDALLDVHSRGESDGAPVFDRAHVRAAFLRGGDVFIRDLRSRSVVQVTRSDRERTSLQWSDDGRLLSFRAGNEWFIDEVESNLVSPAARLELADDPDATPKPDDLRDVQDRLFSTLRKEREDKKALRRHADALRAADAARSAAPFDLGTEVEIVDTELAPSGRWLAVITTPKSREKGREGKLTRYVTESGFEEFETVRTRVGRNAPAPQAMLLIDLRTHSIHPITFDALPGIHDDPLRAIRAENHVAPPVTMDGPRDQRADRKGHQPDPGPVPRPVVLASEEAGGAATLYWTPSGDGLAVVARAVDNKDRWLATVDLQRFSMIPEYRATDAAWVNWDHAEAGWIDEHTLWFVSEQSGFAHLYRKPLTGQWAALTSGRFEVSQPVLSEDRRWIYFIANVNSPAEYEVFRVPTAGGGIQQLTRMQGVESFVLSPDQTSLLVMHSSPYIPPQLAVVKIAAGTGPRLAGTRASAPNSPTSSTAVEDGRARELTDTRTSEYKAFMWQDPMFVNVPSTHFAGTLPAKLYVPRTDSAGKGHSGATANGANATDVPPLRPAVLFVHGAGYLQNVHRRFPAYFREQMFHNHLAQRGFVVLDMDYRGSEGYGRDWRTAIYRNMGGPEVDDLLDAKRWLVETQHVDARRIGIYGGSYGGFLTLMMLFKHPGEFAAGAALRPVTDWMQYNHEYTSDILNDPQSDALAYRRSSPIELAEGLADPLLICHGVMDDNVLFQDSMRLYQRLIELHKNHFWLAPYPLERHTFQNADSWLDEYKRIDALFDQYVLRPRS